MFFELNQIFDKMYPPEAAQWCNSNNAYITELEPQNGVRCFQIVAVPEPPRTDEINTRISELQAYLTSTDWYAIRYADTGTPIPDDVKQARADARAEIDALRAELATIS